MKKLSKKKRVAIIIAICASAALVIYLAMTAISPGSADMERAISTPQSQDPAPQIKDITDSAVTVPDIEAEEDDDEEDEEQTRPATGAAISPDSGEHITADF